MAQDDPENRIADLERQLGEQRRGADPPPVAPHGWLTPEQVRNTTFSNSAIGRGYSEAEVDEFIDRVEAALRDPTGLALTPEQVRTMAFSKPPLGKRGYNQDEVDQFRCRVEQQLQSRQGRFPPPPQTGFPPSSTGQLHTSHAAGRRSGTGGAKKGGWRDRMLIGAIIAGFLVWLAAGIFFLLVGVAAIRVPASVGAAGGRSMMLGLLMIGISIFIVIKVFFS
jgi:DivIVA domain-containing protein